MKNLPGGKELEVLTKKSSMVNPTNHMSRKTALARIILLQIRSHALLFVY